MFFMIKITLLAILRLTIHLTPFHQLTFPVYEHILLIYKNSIIGQMMSPNVSICCGGTLKVSSFHIALVYLHTGTQMNAIILLVSVTANSLIYTAE